MPSQSQIEQTAKMEFLAVIIVISSNSIMTNFAAGNISLIIIKQ